MARSGFTEQELKALNKNEYVLQSFTVNFRIDFYDNPQYNFSSEYFSDIRYFFNEEIYGYEYQYVKDL